MEQLGNGCRRVDVHDIARVERAQEIDALLTRVVGTLLSAGVVTMERVAQDGMKVRASAGAPSFRRKETLERCLAEAKEQVEALRKELDEEPGASDRRRRAARERAAEDRKARVEEALKQWQDVADRREGSKEEREAKARVSTTDPEARVMNARGRTPRTEDLTTRDAAQIAA